MSANKIDELFKTGLNDHPVTPSAEAWSKLQGKMNAGKKKTPIIWLRVAAAVSLLLMSGWLIYNENQTKPLTNGSIAKTNDISVSPNPVTEEASNAVADKSTPQTTEVVVPKTKNTEAVAHKESSAAPMKPQLAKATPAKEEASGEPVAPNQQQPANEPKLAINEPTPAQPEALTGVENTGATLAEAESPEIVEVEKATAVAVAAVEPMETPEVKITFKADDDEKFLTPVKELIASDQPKEKKGGFNKLMASARSLGSRNIIGELRETKDELLSGNLKLGIVKNEKVNNSK